MITYTRRPAAWRRRLTLLMLAFLAQDHASAALDLNNSRLHHLDNGLTVILLQDSNFPVASVQMLYKVGARNEVTGKTGLAHFVEHMAFRETQNFADTEVVSRIYARGGEWHGYTWTDQTTYFATVPKESLDLLLRIESDRMTGLVLKVDEIEPERGSVLAEMHMYENSPISMLIDAVMFTSFLAHPYRNNTIGFEDDINSITHADLLQFYKRHYHPGNAVLAVVGDFDSDAALERIKELFGDLERRPATAPPHTAEPPQRGLRRIHLSGAAAERRFMIAYRAPRFTDADFPAMLVLQEVLGGGSGVNFLQNDWGTPIRQSSPLDGITEEMTTWLPPSEQDYVFVIGGRVTEDEPELVLEQAIEDRLQTVRATTLSQEQVDAAISAVLDQLVFDVQTTEDAAHQLAYFAGINALDQLLSLPEQLLSVTAADLRRVARRFLNPDQRTIAWYRQADELLASDQRSAPARRKPIAKRPEHDALDNVPVPPPVTQRLSGGIPVLIRASDLSSSVHLKIVVQGQSIATNPLNASDPVAGYSAWNRLSRPSGLGASIDEFLANLAQNRPAHQEKLSLSRDPETRMQQEFAMLAGNTVLPIAVNPVPLLIAVAGDVDPENTIALLESSFGEFKPPEAMALERKSIPFGERTIKLGIPVAQAGLGYVVAAPSPFDRDFDAYRLLLYILSHGYEGRLGKEAISRRGLAYYIDASYHSAGGPGWITLHAGVDPAKVDALKKVFYEELRRLETRPSTPAEVEEAREHLLGRAISAAQSNEELTATLARDWLWFGEPVSYDSLRQRLGRTDVDDVRRVSAAFAAGLTIAVVP